MTRVRRLVVVGAGLAGVRAAESARQAGFDGTITMIGAETHLPYDRPPLSKAFLDDAEPSVPELVIGDELGVELLLGTPATGLDTAARAVLTGERRVPYDAVVLATGASARNVFEPDGLTGVHTLRTRDDAVAVRRALDAGARTVVVGAGFIGSEVASGARRRGLGVVVVEAQPVPLVRAVGERMGAMCADLHRHHGTGLRCGVSVAAIEGAGHVERVVLSDGSVLPADLVVVGAGATPATEWLDGSGLELDDGVVCDETLCAGPPGVYAAGDLARWPNPVFGRSMRLEHWTAAAEQARVAARNAVDPAAAKPCSTVPYFWSDWYGRRIQFAGIPASDEVRIVEGEPGGNAPLVALYREGDRLAGALTVDGRARVMKYRALIQRGASWEQALAHHTETNRQGVPG